MKSVQTQIEKLQYRIDNKLVWVFMYVMKMFSILLLLGHWFGCLWYFLGRSASDPSESWFSTAVIDHDDFWSCYVSSVYFCVTTIITVGYGDVHAVNLREKLFAMGMMMIAWMTLLVISGVLTSQIVRYDEQGAKFSEMMNRAMKYMIKNQIDSELQSFVRTFLLQQIEHEATEEVHTELMTHLESSARMKSELYVGLWGKHLKRFGWFSRFPSHLLGNVCSGCEMIRYSPGDVVVRPGNIGDGVFFVIKGHLVEDTRQLGPSEYFGDTSLFVPFKWRSQVRCETYCELLYLAKSKLEEWMSENEDYMQLLRNQRAITALLNNELGIFNECLSAGIDPNYCDPNNNFLLHTACRMQLVDSVQDLLWKGALTSQVDPNTKKFPLQIALETKNLYLIDIVAEYSDMSMFADGDPPPIAEIIESDLIAQTLVLFAAAVSGYNRVVAFVLDKCPTHINVNNVFFINDDAYAKYSNKLTNRAPLGQRYEGFCLSDLAAKFGHAEVIDTLCDHQADFNAAVNERPKLPLHYAVEAGQKEAVSRLVKHGAQIILKDQNGLTPLDLACRLEIEEKDQFRLSNRRAITLMLRGLNLHDLSKDGRIDELKSAIADKCDPNIIHPKTGRSPLQYAADANQVAVIKELLSNEADIDFTGVSQVTALYSALMKGHLDASQALLEGGSDPNRALGNGSTPLMAAIKKGSMALIDLLIKFGAKPTLDDVKAAFEKKEISFIIKMKNGVAEGIWTPYLAGGESMFHQFCRKADVAIVNLAIEFNADVTRTNKEGLSPLEIAAGNGKDKICDVLIKAAKSYLGQPELRDYLGKGLVHAVKTIKGTLPAIKLLAAAGADVNYPKVLAESVKAGNAEAVKFLVDQGANVQRNLTPDSFMTLVIGNQLPLIELIVENIDSVDDARNELNVFEAALRANDQEMKHFLCNKFSIDPVILAASGPSVVDTTTLDLEAGRGGRGTEVIQQQRTDSSPNSSPIRRMFSQLNPRSVSRLSSQDLVYPSLMSKVRRSISSLMSRSKLGHEL